MAAVLGSASVLGCFSLLVEFDDSRIPQSVADAALDSALAIDTAQPETLADSVATDSLVPDTSSPDTSIDSAPDSTMDSADEAEVEVDATDAD